MSPHEITGAYLIDAAAVSGCSIAGKCGIGDGEGARVIKGAANASGGLSPGNRPA